MSSHIIDFTVPGEPRTARPRAFIRGDKPGMHKDRFEQMMKGES